MSLGGGLGLRGGGGDDWDTRQRSLAEAAEGGEEHGCCIGRPFDRRHRSSSGASPGEAASGCKGWAEQHGYIGEGAPAQLPEEGVGNGRRRGRSAGKALQRAMVMLVSETEGVRGPLLARPSGPDQVTNGEYAPLELPNVCSLGRI